jgi:uncharacterized protein YjiS (DUF1127 family)
VPPTGVGASIRQEHDMNSISLGPTSGRFARIAPGRTRRRAIGRSARRALNAVRATMQKWQQRSRERAELRRLDDRMLRDIGVTRGDVWHEINKPFWRP